MSGESKKGRSGGGFFDERSDAQPATRSTEKTINKVVVLTGREELPNELCEELFRPIRSGYSW